MRVKCNENFHPREYIENNIKFRILTSSEFIKYKTAQTFILKEIEFNTIFNFSKTSKEIILFKFDVWFDFLCELEQYLLRKPILNEDDLFKIENLAKEREIYIKKVMFENEKTFDKDFLSIWIKVHNQFTNFFKNILKIRGEIEREYYFERIMNILILSMQHLLYEIYEIDNIIYHKKLFISVDEFDKYFIDNICKTCIFKENFCYFKRKLDIYLKLNKSEKIVIKNYLSDKCEIVDKLSEFIRTNYKKQVEVE